MKKIVVTDFITETTAHKCMFEDPEYHVVFVNATKEEEAQKHIKDADAIMVWHEIPITDMSFDTMENCSLIVRMGAGYDNVDLQRASRENIVVSNVPDYGTDVVADHTMALLLNLSRNINAYNNSDVWDPFQPQSLTRLTNQKIGIIGMGRIGTAVAMRAKAFGLDVQYYDPYVPSGTDKALNVRCMELDELLRTSDIVSVHTPLTEETRGMLNKNKLSQMKESSILINTARGEVIPLDDLYWALKNDVIKATGVDVLETEPAPLDHPLVASWKANDPWIRGRLCITPHAAFFTDESFDELKYKGWLTVKDFFEKSKIKNCVNIRSSYGA